MLSSKYILLWYGILMPWWLLSQTPPSVTISNSEITTTIYTPDAEKGYYQGARFDWAGVIPSLEYKGHSYFGQWFDVYDPKIHDAIMGPVEAFDPLGYEEVAPQGNFTKVGIGLLKKIEDKPYHFSRPYEIIDYGTWRVENGENWISFVHTLTAGEYPYRYEKNIRLEQNKMIIEHRLTNTGTKTIDTKVFNHNFFMIDKAPIGPGYQVNFDFDIQADSKDLLGLAVLKNNELRFTKALDEVQRPRLREITGYGSSFDDYSFSIEQRDKKAGVYIRGDRPLSHMIFWSMNKTLSPEPYIDVKVASGKDFTWTLVYEFYTL